MVTPESKVAVGLRTCKHCDGGYNPAVIPHAFNVAFCCRRCAELDWLSEFEGVPNAFDDTDLKHPSLARVAGQIATVEHWASGPITHYRKPGLLLYGVTSGRGKSRVGTAAFLNLVAEDWNGRGVGGIDLGQWFNVMQFRREYARVMMNGQDRAEWMQDLASTRNLFIDDVDKLRPSDGLLELLFAVLDERLSDHHITILTTNLSGDDLAMRWGDDVGPYLVRRLRDYCLCLDFDRDTPLGRSDTRNTQ